MKKQMTVMAAMMLVALTACESDYNEYADTATDATTSEGQTELTFLVQGEFSLTGFDNGGAQTRSGQAGGQARAPQTRTAITADGKQMTDLWLLDYVDGQLKQQLHQTQEDADFGAPHIALDYGQHTLYFVVSRGKDAVLDTGGKTLSWGTPSDTFWQQTTLNVSQATASTQAVTLDRVTTRISITLQDAIPEGLSQVVVTPDTWYYGLDYTSGQPTDNRQQDVTISIPGSYAGRTNTTVSCFGMSGKDEWTTDITIRATASDGATLGLATIEDAPFRANRSTNYSGQLFASGGTFGISLSDEWDDAYTGEW